MSDVWYYSLLDTKCSYPSPHIAPPLYIVILANQSLLRIRGTVEKGLSLCRRHPGVSEKPSGRPAVPARHRLRAGALAPLKDYQCADDEPEEEVDPHCRLRGDNRTHRMNFP